MGLLDRFKKAKPYESRMDFNVQGSQYYLDAYQKLSISNPLWNSTPELIIKSHRTMNQIPEFYYKDYPVKLVPEPKNEHDPNAVKVLVDGKKIGYVPSELCSKVKKIIRDNPKYGLSAWMCCGNYKIVSENGTTVTSDGHPSTKIYLYY